MGSGRPMSNLSFVPKHLPPSAKDVDRLQSFLNSISQLLVITGAGVSTESGIPDYRSEGVGLYARSKLRPMKIQEFLSSREAQRRYWARNFFGWPRFQSLQPNSSHFTLKAWQDSGRISGLVTQNVDGLHQKAGSHSVIELHGTGHLVTCLQCNYTIDRQLFQNVLVDMNRHLNMMLTESSPQDESAVRPDGDVDLVDQVVHKFILPGCPKCETGVMKPYIVFFGDNVPKERVDKIYDILNQSDGLLVLGSSLQTFSAYRYIISAKQRNLPIGIVNLGPTRADPMSSFKLMSRVGELLPLINIEATRR